MIRHLEQPDVATKTTAFCQIFMPQISNIDFTVAWQPQMEVSCGMHPVKCKYYRCLDNIHNNYMHITMPTKIWVWLVHCSAWSPWFLTLDEDDKHKKTQSQLLPCPCPSPFTSRSTFMDHHTNWVCTQVGSLLWSPHIVILLARFHTIG